MADPRLPSVSARLPPAFPPRWAFFKGLLTGVVIEVPALAAGVWLLARLGVGDPEAPFMKIMRLTALFAGVAAVLTAGGVGRIAAHASVENQGGRRSAMRVARRAHAAASVGLILIATIPHGLPDHLGLGWLTVIAMGAVVGLICGMVLGAVCGGGGYVRIGDVMAAAIKKPSEALRQLLDPEDLIKLGAAVRQRTTTLLEGIFEPAAQRPTPPPGELTDKHIADKPPESTKPPPPAE
jgi:hypothetical protein